MIVRRRRWRLWEGADWRRTLAIIFVAQLFSATGFSIIFPFLPLYVQDLGSTTGLSVELLSGLVFSAQAFTMMLASPLWGALADRHGRKLMVERATFGGAVLLLLMALAQSAEQLVLLRAVQGMITGTVSAANALVAAEAPRERTGFAMGLIQVALWSGISVGPLIGGAMADAFGFRVPFVVTAVLLAGAGLLVWRGVQERFAPSPRIIDQQLSFVAEWRHVISMRGIPLTYAVRFLSGLGRNMITPIAPLFIASLLPATAPVSSYTGLVVGVQSFAATASAVYLGRLGDRIGHRPVLVGSALAAGLFYLPQSLVTEAWQLLALQALTGVASGGIVAAPSALLARFTEPGEEGAVYGLDNSVVAGARAVAPLAGSAVAVGLNMRGTFALSGVIYLAAALLSFLWLPREAAEAERAEAPAAPPSAEARPLDAAADD